MDWYYKWPEWLRWILLLPVSITASLLFTLFVSFFRDDWIIARAPISLISMMYAVYYLAPRAPVALSLVVIVLRVLLTASLLTFVYLNQGTFERQTWIQIVGEIIAYALALALWFGDIRRR